MYVVIRVERGAGVDAEPCNWTRTNTNADCEHEATYSTSCNLGRKTPVTETDGHAAV